MHCVLYNITQSIVPLHSLCSTAHYLAYCANNQPILYSTLPKVLCHFTACVPCRINQSIVPLRRLCST